MDAVSSATSGFNSAKALLDVATQRISEGYVLPEVVSARETASIQIDAQVNVLKDALTAQAQILDLLV